MSIDSGLRVCLLKSFGQSLLVAVGDGCEISSVAMELLPH